MLSLLSFLFTTISSFAWAIIVPGADSPSFYLIAVSTGTSSVRPAILSSGGGYASLQGSGFPIQSYFFQGQLKAALDRSGEPSHRPYVDTGFTDTGSCATYGRLGYLEGSSTSTNKCASYSSFQIQSNPENSQLGARLTFNSVGGFYSCGAEEEIWYKVNEGDGPTSCYPVQLYTVPVV
ncbi:hypothetical protein FA13DRAFT_1694415 [Coprinellus micaceus]|uniref:Uncharacterized protein n=1 Tax=Coprinellus micaceus TaxID=71717 RepID=A0A4Y7SNR8_COPMI|nr:hypothetical protein FA13DRAFT_1694415 [Coprinellus micaceus]